MNNSGKFGVRAALVAGAVAALAGSAQAELSQIILQIQAEVNGQVGTYEVPQSAGVWNGGQFTWQLQQPVTIMSNLGLPVATLENASVVVFHDPVVAVNFNLASTNQNTAFTVSSPLLSFPVINNAVGAASAAVSVTDLLGDGATLTPMGAGAYTSQYNGLVPVGTTFADLLGAPVVAPAFSTATGSAEFPGGGSFAPLAGAVTDISAQWQFTLSPNDIASGTGVFTVIPAPGTLALLAMGGLAAGRRRR